MTGALRARRARRGVGQWGAAVGRGARTVAHASPAISPHARNIAGAGNVEPLPALPHSAHCAYTDVDKISENFPLIIVDNFLVSIRLELHILLSPYPFFLYIDHVLCIASVNETFVKVSKNRKCS